MTPTNRVATVAVECPQCGAHRGELCHGPRGAQQSPHKIRRDRLAQWKKHYPVQWFTLHHQAKLVANAPSPALSHALLYRGVCSRVARALESTRSHVSRVASGERRSVRVEAALLQEIARVEASLREVRA